MLLVCKSVSGTSTCIWPKGIVNGTDVDWAFGRPLELQRRRPEPELFLLTSVVHSQWTWHGGALLCFDETSHLQQGANSKGRAASQARKPDPRPAPGDAAALNAKAEAAAAQPLPDSDDSDDENALDGVKGILRTAVPKENGSIGNEKPRVNLRLMYTCQA